MIDYNEHNLLIDIKDLTWWYPDSDKLLFHKFNFALYKNDFCILMWKSGVWKSTIVKFLVWQIKPPTRSVYHKREDISRYSEDEIQIFRRKMWIVFQDYKLLDDLSVKENIIQPLKLYWYSEFTTDKKFTELSKKLHLDKIDDIPVKLLSWWEKQKVWLARALAHNPEFIIADEPTWNLDWEHTQEIADILIEVNKAWNTVLLITHDIHLLNYIKSKHSTKIVVM